MDVVWSQCVGLDIGKKFLVACALVSTGDGPPRKELRTFGTMTRDLLALRDWIVESKCEAVAMESTGPYWRPIWNVLEDVDGIALVLTNPQHMKAVPGRKTDVKDAEWIADLLRHGLLKASYVPSRDQRELRELERYRKSIIEERAREVNRVQKVLEGANIKLGSVVSNVTGVSGTKILNQLAHGVDDAPTLAALANDRIKATREELEGALDGYMNAHQRRMLAHQLDHIEYLDGVIAKLDGQIREILGRAKKVLERLQTVPGIGQRTAEVILAEVGSDVSHFPSPAHLGAWAGLAPGQNESAGKRKPARVRPGNKALRNAMVEAARAASRTKNTFLSAKHAHLSKRLKGKKATVALARFMMEIVFHILASPDATYEEKGADYYDQRDHTSLQRRAVEQLERLGYKVTLEPSTAA
jgi:transposase